MIDLLALLKRLEWPTDYFDIASCPECGARKDEGPHKEGCQLAEAIRMLESGQIVALPRGSRFGRFDKMSEMPPTGRIYTENEPPNLPPIP